MISFFGLKGSNCGSNRIDFAMLGFQRIQVPELQWLHVQPITMVLMIALIWFIVMEIMITDFFGGLGIFIKKKRKSFFSLSLLNFAHPYRSTILVNFLFCILVDVLAVAVQATVQAFRNAAIKPPILLSIISLLLSFRRSIAIRSAISTLIGLLLYSCIACVAAALSRIVAKDICFSGLLISSLLSLSWIINHQTLSFVQMALSGCGAELLRKLRFMRISNTVSNTYLASERRGILFSYSYVLWISNSGTFTY